METRSYEIRASDNQATGEPLKLEGLAIVFGSCAEIGGIKEIISPDALRGVDLNDVALLVNHNGHAIPLARSPKTMSLVITDRGLEMSATLPDTEQAKAVHEAVKRGDLSHCSFMFEIGESVFDEVTQVRTITRIEKIWEVSIVSFPVYKETSVTARSIENIKKSEDNNMSNPIIENLEASKDTTDTHSKHEYRSAFFKSLLGREMTEAENRAMSAARAEKRADSFNTMSSSAAVIPDQTLNEVISQARPIGGLFNEIRLFNIPSNLSVPIGTPASPAAWHVEGSVIDRKDVKTTYVSFRAFELIKLLSMSVAAQRMTIPAFESYLTAELRNSITEALNQAIVHGTGDGQPEGILTGITWTDENSIDVTNLKAPDILELVSLLPPGYAAGAKFAMSYSTLYSQVYPLQTATGDFIFFANSPENSGAVRLFGFPIILDDNLPFGTILFSNFKYYGMNIPQGIMIETSRHASFDRGLIDYRAIAIADGRVILPAAFVKLSVA